MARLASVASSARIENVCGQKTATPAITASQHVDDGDTAGCSVRRPSTVMGKKKTAPRRPDWATDWLRATHAADSELHETSHRIATCRQRAVRRREPKMRLWVMCRVCVAKQVHQSPSATSIAALRLIHEQSPAGEATADTASTAEVRGCGRVSCMADAFLVVETYAAVEPNECSRDIRCYGAACSSRRRDRGASSKTTSQYVCTSGVMISMLQRASRWRVQVGGQYGAAPSSCSDFWPGVQLDEPTTTACCIGQSRRISVGAGVSVPAAVGGL